jgi:hypothetical protein
MEKKFIIQKVKKWPKDFEKHILNTVKLYFEDKDIDFVDGGIYSSLITDIYSSIGIKNFLSYLKLEFDINGFRYSVNIYNINSKINGIISYIEEKNEEIPEHKIEKTFFFATYINYFIMHFIAQFEVINAYNCILNIEKIIKDDYNNRKGKGDNGGNEPDIILPPPNSYDLIPTFSSS